MKNICVLLCAALLLCGCAVPAGAPRKAAPADAVSRRIEERFFIGTAAVHYYALKNEWPESLDGLKAFWMILRGNPETPRLDRYAEATFTPLPDGSVRIEYVLRGGAAKREWVTVSPPTSK